MSTRTWWSIIAVLLIVIVVLTVTLVAMPKPAEAPTVATSTAATSTSSGQATSTQPLHTRVVVTSPKAGATVGKSFTVTGEAPGNWYFEASFPIQVRDKDNNKIGQTTGQAQSDWMTTEQVPFKADIAIEGYSGPATLVLLRDNPSGMPENDDSLEIPIVIQ